MKKFNTFFGSSSVFSLTMVLIFCCLFDSNSASAQAPCWTPWVSGTQYCAGAQVSYNGYNYQNCFCSNSVAPSDSFDVGGNCTGTGRYWKQMGACINCTAGSVNAGGALSSICPGGTSGAMGGSIGGGASGGTWSGGSGSWSNPNSPGGAQYTASAGESGNITVTLTTSGGCSPVSASKTITVNALPALHPAKAHHKPTV